MKNSDVTLASGRMIALQLPTESSNPQPGQLGVTSNEIKVSGANSVEIYKTDLQIAQSILSKVRHWWPLGMTYDISHTYYADVHGGLELRRSGLMPDSPPVRSGSTARSTNISKNSGLLGMGKPTWMTKDWTIEVMGFLRLEDMYPGSARIVLGDAPAGDSDPSFNVGLQLYVQNANLPAFMNAFWEYGSGTDVNANTTTGQKLNGAQNYCVGFNRRASVKQSSHFLNGVGNQLDIPYNENPTGANGPLAKLCLGNQSLSNTDPSVTTVASNGVQADIQDFIIFDKALTDDERLWMYNLGKGRDYASLYALAQMTHYWTPAMLYNKLVWVKGDHKDNVSSSGLVSRLENLAGFMPGVPYNSETARRFRDNVTTLNGRKVLTGELGSQYLGHFVFPSTNFSRAVGVPGVAAFAVLRRRPNTTSFSVAASVNIPSSTNKGQLFGLEVNYGGVAGRLSSGGRRTDTDPYIHGVDSDSNYNDWVIVAAWNNYTNGTNNLRVNGGATKSSTVFTTGGSSGSSNSAPYPVGIGGNGYNTNNAGGLEIAEILVQDCLVINDNAQILAMTQRMEGYLAHQWGLTSLLPANHPYRTQAPVV